MPVTTNIGFICGAVRDHPIGFWILWSYWGDGQCQNIGERIAPCLVTFEIAMMPDFAFQNPTQTNCSMYTIIRTLTNLAILDKMAIYFHLGYFEAIVKVWIFYLRTIHNFFQFILSTMEIWTIRKHKSWYNIHLDVFHLCCSSFWFLQAT